MLPYLIKFCTISSKPSYGSSHWGAGVLFPGLAIKWKQSQGAGWLYRSGPTHVPVCELRKWTRTMYIPIGILHWSMLCAYARNPVTHNHVVVAFVICIVLYCIVIYVLYHFVFLIIKKKQKKTTCDWFDMNIYYVSNQGKNGRHYYKTITQELTDIC